MSSSDGSSDTPGSVFVSYKFQAQVLIHTISSSCSFDIWLDFKSAFMRLNKPNN